MATSLPGSESTPPTGAAQPGTPSEPTPLYEVTCNIGNGEHTISEFEALASAEGKEGIAKLITEVRVAAHTIMEAVKEIESGHKEIGRTVFGEEEYTFTASNLSESKTTEHVDVKEEFAKKVEAMNDAKIKIEGLFEKLLKIKEKAEPAKEEGASPTVADTAEAATQKTGSNVTITTPSTSQRKRKLDEETDNPEVKRRKTEESVYKECEKDFEEIKKRLIEKKRDLKTAQSLSNQAERDFRRGFGLIKQKLALLSDVDKTGTNTLRDRADALRDRIDLVIEEIGPATKRQSKKPS